MNGNKLMPGDIAAEVSVVLREAAEGKGERPQALSAYQVLDRLPATLRERVVAERGWPGKGSGKSYSAASLVGDAAERIPGVRVTYFDCRGVRFTVAGQEVEPGYEVCGLYSLPSER